MNTFVKEPRLQGPSFFLQYRDEAGGWVNRFLRPGLTRESAEAAAHALRAVPQNQADRATVRKALTDWLPEEALTVEDRAAFLVGEGRGLDPAGAGLRSVLSKGRIKFSPQEVFFIVERAIKGKALAGLKAVDSGRLRRRLHEARWPKDVIDFLIHRSN